MPLAWTDPPGVVKDIAQGEPFLTYAPEIAVFYDTIVPEGTVNGATLSNGVWVNPPPLPEIPASSIVEPVPNQVTLFQARTQLRRMGLFQAIDDYIEAIKATNPEYWEAWNYANNCYRDSSFVQSLAALCNLTNEQTDAAFIAANKIEV